MATNKEETENFSPSTNQEMRHLTVPDGESDEENDLPPNRLLEPDDNKNDINDTKKSCICTGKLCPILHPYGPFKICWDLIVTVAITVSCLEIPFTMAFEVPVDLSTNIGIMAFCIDIFLCCDICVTFRTAIFDKYDKLRLNFNPRVIAVTYLKGWFVFDFLTSFPFNALNSARAGSNNDDSDTATRAIKLLRLIRLFRLLRIFRIFKMLGIVKEFNRLFPKLKKWIGIFKVMTFMLFCAHYLGCMWYAVGKNSVRDGNDSWMLHLDTSIDPDDTNVGYSYSVCFYWSVVTLFTTGYGDITARNTHEMWASVFVIVVGSIMTAYLIGTLTSLLTEGDRVYQYQVDQLDEAYMFCEHFRLSGPLVRAITTHIQYDCEYNYVSADPIEFLDNLPQHLRQKVEMEISHRAMNKVDIFRDFPNDILGQIMLKLKSIGCNGGYKLYQENDWATELYVLRIGVAKLYYNNTLNPNKKTRILRRGDIVGEDCIINIKRTNTLKCKTWCEFYVLKRDDLKSAIFDHLNNDEADEKWNEIKKLIKENDIERRINWFESKKLMKAKSKIDEDTIMDISHKGLMTQSNMLYKKQIEKDKKYDDCMYDSDEKSVSMEPAQNASDFVEKIRAYNRTDSGLRDYKMAKHNQRLFKENKEYDDKHNINIHDNQPINAKIIHEEKQQNSDHDVDIIQRLPSDPITSIQLANVHNDSRHNNNNQKQDG